MVFLAEAGRESDLVLSMCLSALLQPARFSIGSSTLSSSLDLFKRKDVAEAFPPPPSHTVAASLVVVSFPLSFCVCASLEI